MPLRLLAACLIAAASFLTACEDASSRAEVRGMRLRPAVDNYPMLTGFVVNTSDRPLGSADVAITLYDEQNQPIGDEMVQVRNVAPGDSARFERRLDRPASGARLRHVTSG